MGAWEELRAQLEAEGVGQPVDENPDIPCPLISGAGNIRNIKAMAEPKLTKEVRAYLDWKRAGGTHPEMAEIERRLRVKCDELGLPWTGVV